MTSFKQYFLTESYTTRTLKSDYALFNNTLFNSELPDSSMFKLTLAKKSVRGYSGYVKTLYNNNSLPEIKELMVSSEYTDDSIRGLLIHEMIHIWMVLNNYHEDMNVSLHGKEFITKLKAIQMKTPIKIPADENDNHVLKLNIDTSYKNYDEPDWMKDILSKYKAE